MAIHYRQQGDALIVFGNTYPVREQLKSLGGRFLGGEKTWRIPLSPAALATVSGLAEAGGGGVIGEAPSPLTPAPPAGASSPTPTDGDALPTLPGMTVRQLVDRASLALQAAFPLAIWVTGEIQNCSRKGGSLYFDLAEGRNGGHANATLTVRSVLWSNTLTAIKAKHGEARLNEVLQDGMQVRCLCSVQFYKDRGQLSLVVEDIDPAFTKGALALAREQLLKELRSKGLDQAQKRLSLAPFPFRVGLISATGSRALSDFLDQLASLKFPGTVLLCPATMQGESTPKAVCAALATLLKHGVDLVVLTRGGGSAADLRWFDAPEIAYAIAGAKVPVVAAIGHHEDVCVAEEICFFRQKTPTAAADFVLSRFVETKQRIDLAAAGMARTLGLRVEAAANLTAAALTRLMSAAERALAGRAERLTALAGALARRVEGRIAAGSQSLAQLRSTLAESVQRLLTTRETRLFELERTLVSKDPKPWLAEGWTQLTYGKGPLRSVKDVNPGAEVVARLADGQLKLRVLAAGPVQGKESSES